jgi:hypothetical protein
MILNNLYLFHSFFSRSPFGSLEGNGGKGVPPFAIPHFLNYAIWGIP